MINITVLENYNKDFNVTMELEGTEPVTRVMYEDELHQVLEDAKDNRVNLFFDAPTDIHIVLLEEDEDEDEYLVNLFKYEFGRRTRHIKDYEIDWDLLKAYKRESSAHKRMISEATNRNCHYEISNC